MSNAELIKRLEEAESGSRELDAEIFRATPPVDPMASLCACTGACMPGHPAYRGACGVVPRYTTSLDAALALIADRSPIHGPVSLIMAGTSQCAIYDTDPCGRGVQAFGNTPALSCCIALLKALDQEVKTDGD